MKQHNFLQGTPEWHAHRAHSKNASDAPAMLGCSPYTTRAQLLHALHTGMRVEATPDRQRIFDAGHAIEAAQRAAAENLIGEDLFPVVGSQEVDGVLLSASFDGITMGEDVVYECKTLNADLRAALPYAGEGSDCPNDSHSLPKHYRVQMEQQLAVSGAQRVLFVAATKDGSDVRRCWYYPDLQLRAEIIAGWKQLDADLAAYTPPAAAAVVVPEPVQSLPAVSVQVTGELVLRDNFKVFETALRDFLEHRLIREPKTDQDFADLDVQIKAMKGAEAALDAAEGQMLAQIQSVDQAKKTKDMLSKLVRDNRLMAEKLLASEKERRRGEIVASGIGALKAHVDGLNKRLGRAYIAQVPADFGGAVKGLKSLASMEDKIAGELARAKIAANEIADRIQENLKTLDELDADPLLFPDHATLVLKAPDDCRAAITSRIAEQQRKEAAKLEAERARIRAEEQEKLAREQQQREAEARQQQEAEARAEQQRQQTETRVAAEEARAAEVDRTFAAIAAPAAPPAPAPNVHPMPTKAPAAPASPPTLRLGQINALIAPLSIDAAGLASLGFPHAATDKAAKLYHHADFPRIRAALVAHLQAVQMQEAA